MQQINRFVTMMKEKGYDGNFINGQSDVAGSLETLLGLEMMKNVQEHQDNKITCCSLLTITEGQPKVSDFTACDFIIRYQPDDGFQVANIYIDRYSKEGQIKSTIKLTIDSPKLIPKKEAANTLARTHVHVMRLRPRHGFSLN